MCGIDQNTARMAMARIGMARPAPAPAPQLPPIELTGAELDELARDYRIDATAHGGTAFGHDTALRMMGQRNGVEGFLPGGQTIPQARDISAVMGEMVRRSRAP